MMDTAPQPNIDAEAASLLTLPHAKARQVFGDRVARAFLASGDQQARALDFNARLATRVRQIATRRKQQTMWEEKAK